MLNYTFEQIQEAARKYIQSDILKGADKTFLHGMEQGFISGAMWAQRQIEAEIEQNKTSPPNVSAGIETSTKEPPGNL